MSTLNPQDSTNPELKRSLSLSLVTFYGLGNILGAGVYVLIGSVAGEAGYLAPFAFLLAAAVAALTAFSFAELSSRFPVSAGEAVYVEKGFGKWWLAMTVGLLIIMTGIVSAATISRGFVGYLQVFLPATDWLIIVALLSALGALAAWGISQSVAVAAALTLLEIGGLLLIVGVALPDSNIVMSFTSSLVESAGNTEFAWGGLVAGAFLAFYAFIGFEDMVNVAEEVKQPQRNLPIAIFLALGLATLLYGLVAIVAVATLPPEQLSESDAPLALIYLTSTGRTPWLITLISLFAVVNGALIQIIMASRVCYGMARNGWLPSSLGKVNAETATPVVATVLVTTTILIAALALPIETLANITTYLLLIIFCLVNLALIAIKRRENKTSEIKPAFTIPLFLPYLAVVVSGGFLLTRSIIFLLATD